MRYSEERQTRQAGSIVYSGADYLFLNKNRFIFVYVPLSDINLFKNNAPTHQVELCFVHACYTTSVGKQPLHAFKLACGLPFLYINELHRVPARVWLGTKREYVHLFSSCMYTTYVGLCERDTNVERYTVWVREFFLGGVNQKM